MVETTAAKLRLVTLARIYEEFCGFAWDENKETPVTWMTEDLAIDDVALGMLAAPICGDIDEADEDELREYALIGVTDSLRAEVFLCLNAAYGGEVRLYSRLWHSCSSPKAEDDGDELEATGPNCLAFEFVMNGFGSR